MTALLEKAFERAFALPKREQETIDMLVLEEIADIHAYGALHDRADSEIAAGQSSTSTAYWACRGCKAK
jgi:hypothetical protein